MKGSPAYLRAPALACRMTGALHDGLDLFEVVDVESGDAVTVDRSVVEQFAHGNERHGFTFEKVGNRLVTLQILPSAGLRRVDALWAHMDWRTAFSQRSMRSCACSRGMAG
jgi:hypothetical protein